jgi:hypothetical protein
LVTANSEYGIVMVRKRFVCHARVVVAASVCFGALLGCGSRNTGTGPGNSSTGDSPAKKPEEVLKAAQGTFDKIK